MDQRGARAASWHYSKFGSICSGGSREKAFDIRTVMRAVADQDHEVLERWAGMAEADTAVVQDAHMGGHPVCLLGIESQSVRRSGFPPTDGPESYTAGTLFPKSSKKAARAINAASGNRPLVVLANLSGFDGSPESMRNVQLEYGAEIGRAIVNFRGPIVFCVISRYHGGAFVVFSKALNPEMTVLAVEGSFASVIGGAPAAAVVFTGEVNKRTAATPAMKAWTNASPQVRILTGTFNSAGANKSASVSCSGGLSPLWKRSYAGKAYGSGEVLLRSTSVYSRIRVRAFSIGICTRPTLM